MALDKPPMRAWQTYEICKQYYDWKTYCHAARVASYVQSMGVIPKEYHIECILLAWMHDLLEDTEYTGEDLPPNFKKALQLLTKPKDMKYDDYCEMLRPRVDSDPATICAYYVKIADMKDHLAQKETLTPRLKEKYLSGLAKLL